LGEQQAGKADMLTAIGICREQGLALELQLFEATYAEALSKMGHMEPGLEVLDRAFALSQRTGQRWHDAELNRLRGDFLLRRDPFNTAPAEEALLNAIAIAQQRKARSFELRAALSLVKLYQSTGRPVDAHAVLARALEGFSPTPEFPEIEEAQTLLAALQS
jgi:predicted ATPase